MNSDAKLTLWIIILFCTFFCMMAGTSPADASEKFGAVLIAHGASNLEWNKKIESLHKTIAKTAPCELEVALIGYTHDNTLDTAINKLLRSKSGITELLLIHIAPSSYTYNEQVKAFTKETIVRLQKPALAENIKIVAMDDHPLATAILSQHARDLSRDPAEESLMLVGGGPAEELANISSLMDLERMGEKIRNELGFKEVVCINLRNHSPDIIFIWAINDLRRAAKRLKTQGRVIVVPYVLQKDFYAELESCLKGIIPPEDISKQEILSHPNVEKWVSEVIAQGTEQVQRKEINRNWSIIKKGKKWESESMHKSAHNYGLTGE